jgi:hypothetical protein
MKPDPHATQARPRTPSQNHFAALKKGIKKAARQSDPAVAYQAQKPGHADLERLFREQGVQEGYRKARFEQEAARDLAVQQLLKAVSPPLQAVPATPPTWSYRAKRWLRRQEQLAIWGLSFSFSIVACFVILREVWELAPVVWHLTGFGFEFLNHN